MSRILTKIEKISLYLGYVSGGFVFLMMAIIIIDVVKRHIFNSPTIWADEVSCYLLVGIAFLGSSYTLLKDGHIRVEAVVRKLNSRLRWYVEIIIDFFSLAFLIFFSWQACKFAFHSYSTDWISSTLLRTPLYIPQIFFAVGLLWFALQLTVKIMRRWIK